MISILLVTITMVRACSCLFVVIIEEGFDLRCWGAFAMDEDLGELSKCQ